MAGFTTEYYNYTYKSKKLLALKVFKMRFSYPHEQILGAVYMMEGGMILSIQVSH
jgi:hypothetical protein